MLKQLWNKFCKIFSHYEFLVQLVFAPHFKQRHIPRYNYIKRQQEKNPRGISRGRLFSQPNVESTRAMTRERGSRAESKNCEILSTADRRLDTNVKCPTERASFWVKFPTVRSLTRVKCPGLPGGGDGRFWNWLAHNFQVSSTFDPTPELYQFSTVWIDSNFRLDRLRPFDLGLS